MSLTMYVAHSLVFTLASFVYFKLTGNQGAWDLWFGAVCGIAACFVAPGRREYWLFRDYA